MNLMETIQRAFVGGYASAGISMQAILICTVCTALIAVYIFFVYRLIHKNTFYNRNFNISLIALAIITAAIILTIQSNIVVSLGMVGALSIVRFRSAIKDPMDLVFLFWAISAGIICGAGFAMIAIVTSIVITIIIYIISIKSEVKDTLLLVVNTNSPLAEDDVMKIVEDHSKFSHVRARNMSKAGLNIAIEVKSDDIRAMLNEINSLECVTTVSLVDHEGEATV